MDGKQAATLMRNERKFLQNIVKDITPENGEFRPTDESMTAVQQIRHIAGTVRWFREGAFGKGFDADFEKAAAEVAKPATLDQALKELNETYDDFIAFLESQSAEELAKPMADNPFMGNSPRFVVVTACNEHTAHHRGALTVYLRLVGVTPTMAYA